MDVSQNSFFKISDAIIWHLASSSYYNLCRYFAVQYALPKLDMIAIPDFAFGAMENYGLVTYRETALLFDDKNSAAANKQRICAFPNCWF